jgi:SAM-dependent methyltransferase
MNETPISVMSVEYTETVSDLEDRIRAHKLFSKTSLDDVLCKCLERVPAESSVLDLGCGSGNFYPLFASKARSYVGVDISKDLLGAFRNKQQQSVVLINSSMDDLPLFQRGSFDAIFSIYSIYYSLRPANLVMNLHSALSESGHLFVVGPSRSAHAQEIDEFCNTIANKSRPGVDKNTRIENFHSGIVPEVLQHFSAANVEEIDGSLYFESSKEWARYVASTPQARECSDLDKSSLLELADKYSSAKGCLTVSKFITVVTAAK